MFQTVLVIRKPKLQIDFWDNGYDDWNLSIIIRKTRFTSQSSDSICRCTKGMNSVLPLKTLGVIASLWAAKHIKEIIIEHAHPEISYQLVFMYSIIIQAANWEAEIISFVIKLCLTCNVNSYIVFKIWGILNCICCLLISSNGIDAFKIVTKLWIIY